MHWLKNSIAAMALLLVLPAQAGATTILANGGRYFQQTGNVYSWKYDWYEGYCGKYASWCTPAQFQWKYTTSEFGGANRARWTNPYPTSWPSKVFAFVPRKDATTGSAPYTIVYQGLSRNTSYVNQMAYYDAWAPVGWGQGFSSISAVDLIDSTWESPPGKIAFDEIKIEN